VVAALVELCVYLGPGAGGGGRDQVDDDFERDEWLAAPVAADEGERSVLDLVPLAGVGGKWETWIESPVWSARGLRLQPPPARAVPSESRQSAVIVDVEVSL
jgi:hypothetical protein